MFAVVPAPAGWRLIFPALVPKLEAAPPCKFNAPAPLTFKAPAVVDHVEAAPPVKVSAPEEVEIVEGAFAVKFKAPVVIPNPFAAVNVWLEVKAPRFVVVIPAFPIETEVAFVVPKFKAAAESTVKAPAVVDHVEAAPPVKVKAPPDVKLEALVGVRLTAPAPEAVKFPEVKV